MSQPWDCYNGPVLWMSATLDGTALPNMAYYTSNTTTNAVSWSAPMTAGLGNHSLVLSAGHPSGGYTATTTNPFTDR